MHTKSVDSSFRPSCRTEFSRWRRSVLGGTRAASCTLPAINIATVPCQTNIPTHWNIKSNTLWGLSATGKIWRLTSHSARFKTQWLLQEFNLQKLWWSFTWKDNKSVSFDVWSTPAASDSALRRATLLAAQAFLALHWCLTSSDSVTQNHIRTCNFAEVHHKRQEMAFDNHSHNIYPKISEPINI